MAEPPKAKANGPPQAQASLPAEPKSKENALSAADRALDGLSQAAQWWALRELQASRHAGTQPKGGYRDGQTRPGKCAGNPLA
jgi:hypothetical protein